MKFDKRARTSDIVFGTLVILAAIIVSFLFLVAAAISVTSGTLWRLFSPMVEGVIGVDIANRFIEAFTPQFGNWRNLLMSGTAFGLLWTFIGIKAYIRAERSGRYAKLLVEYPRLKISEIVKSMNRSLRRVSTDLSRMKKMGYFPDLSFDLENKEVYAGDVQYSEPLPQIGDEGETIYRETRLVPVTAIAAAIITGIAFGSDGWALGVVMGVGGGVLAFLFFPGGSSFSEVKRTTPKLKKPAATGNDELDSTLAGIFESKVELLRLCGAISSAKIRTPLKEILRVLELISEYVSENPEKVKALRQFTNYYLPTTVSFLKTYEELESKPDKGENITATLAKIEEVTGNLVDVFKREYDDLFEDKAMDIEAEASVMKAIIKENENII
jgi:hypothetical protein